MRNSRISIDEISPNAYDTDQTLGLRIWMIDMEVPN